MNFFGKKGNKKVSKQKSSPPPEYTPVDFGHPDAFSEANLAQVNVLLLMIYTYIHLTGDHSD